MSRLRFESGAQTLELRKLKLRALREAAADLRLESDANWRRKRQRTSKVKVTWLVGRAVHVAMALARRVQVEWA